MLVEPSNADSKAKQKANKQKVIVALLLCGLLAAILTQPSDQNAETSVETIALGIKEQPAVSTEDVETDRSFTDGKSLSRIEVGSILASDLFVVSQPETNEEALGGEAESLPSPIEVKAIYGGRKSTMTALIGDDVVGMGQELPDGRVVVGVDVDLGVRLAPRSPK